MSKKQATRKIPFAGSASLLLILNLLAGVLNYLYQILLARVLGVDAFGTMYTVFSVLLIMAVPGATFTMLAAKQVAVCDAQNQLLQAWQYLKNQTKNVTLLFTLLLVMGLLLCRPLGQLLHITDKAVLWLMVLACALGFYHPLYSGGMSGLKKFLILGIYALLVPLYKMLGLVAVLPLEQPRDRLLGALLSIVLGSVCTAVLGYEYLAKKLRTNSREPAWDTISSDKQLWIGSFIINICFAIYINIDVIAVRHIGGEALSGFYSAATLFGKMIYYCATAIGTVLLPTVATATQKESTQLLNKTLIAVGGASAVGLVLLNVLKDPLICLLYGRDYLPATQYIGLVSLFSFSIGLLTVLTNFFVGTGETKRPQYALLVLSICVLAIAFFSSNVKTALLVIGLAGLLCDGYLIAAYYRAKKSGE